MLIKTRENLISVTGGSEGGLKIKDIAEAVGMKDQLYFNKVFRRFYQESPRTYRSKL